MVYLDNFEIFKIAQWPKTRKWPVTMSSIDYIHNWPVVIGPGNCLQIISKLTGAFFWISPSADLRITLSFLHCDVLNFIIN